MDSGHIAADQVYFYEFNSKTNANLAARAAKFSFSKITGTLKINKPFLYIKEQLPKRKFQIKICLIFIFIFPKYAKSFLTWTKEKTVFLVCLIL